MNEEQKKEIPNIIETAVVVTDANATNEFGLTKDEMTILKYQLCTGLSDTEIKIFLNQALNKYHLDPFKRQIYAVKRGGKMLIQAGIDGLRAIASRNPAYAGSDIEFVDGEEGLPISAKCTVYKMLGTIRCGFSHTVYFKEYCPAPPNDHMWKKLPHAMLGKCAESSALRKAFPEDISGLYSSEEMEQTK